MPLFNCLHWELNVFPSIILIPAAGPGLPTWACALRMHLNSARIATVGHLRLYRIRTRLDPFFSRRSITFDSSILTHVFRYDPLFFSLDEPLFLLFASSLIQLHKTFLSFVSIAYELAPGNFFGIRFIGTGKKFRRLACTITRCALEHFLVGHSLLRAHFCIWHIEGGIGDRRGSPCGCRPRWQVM